MQVEDEQRHGDGEDAVAQRGEALQVAACEAVIGVAQHDSPSRPAGQWICPVGRTTTVSAAPVPSAPAVIGVAGAPAVGAVSMFPP
ncbi:hypothetical protein GCM10010440_50870 [Kitasatospora cinereorecta]